MKTKFTLLFIIGCFICNTTFAVPTIILKLDDLKAPNNTCSSIPALDYLKTKQIKAGFGAIVNTFDATSLNTLSPYLHATNSKGEKLFEIWNHGLDHVSPEFLGTTYAYQKAHFDQATQLIKQLLGVQMHSFGTPFNANDATTNTVMSEDPNYKVMLFGNVNFAASTGIVNLTHRVDMEITAGTLSYDYLVTNYAKYKDNYADYMVLQGHPLLWDAAELEQFKQIIDYLIAQGCEFVLPYEYYRSLSVRNPLNETYENFGVSNTSVVYKNLTWTASGATAKVIANPNKSGVNMSNNVLQITRAAIDTLTSEKAASGMGYKGVATSSYDMPLTATNCTLELKVLKTVAGKIAARIFPNTNVNGTSTILLADLPGSPDWQTVQFNLSAFVSTMTTTPRFDFEMERNGTVAAQKNALTVLIDDVRLIYSVNPINESFETSNINIWASSPFDRISKEIVANPLVNTLNASSKVLKVTKIGSLDSQSSDLIYTNAYPTTLTKTNSILQVKVLFRASDNGSISSSKMGIRMGGDALSEIQKTMSVSDNWQTLQFDYSTLTNYSNLFNQNKDTLSSVFSFLPRLDKLIDGTASQDAVVMYVDDVKFVANTTASVNDKEQDSQVVSFVDPTNSMLKLQNLPAEFCNVELTNLSGIICKKFTTNSTNAMADVSALLPGIYLVTCNSKAGKVYVGKVIKR